MCLGFMILSVGKIPRKLIFCVCYMHGNDSSHILSSITFKSLMALSKLQCLTVLIFSSIFLRR